MQIRPAHRFGALVVALVVLAAADASAQEEASPQPPPSESDVPIGPSPAAPPPAAPPPPVEASPHVASAARFGDAGVFVVTADSSIGISSTEYSTSNARRFSASFSPGFDYFVIRRFSIGVDVSIAYVLGRGYGADNSLVESTTTTIGGGPRFGVDLPLSELVSFYPRLTMGVESVHRESRLVSGRSLSVAANPIGTPSESLVGPYVNVFAPLLLHPTRHFFVGAGPSLFHEFGKAHAEPDVGGERTTIAARMVVGGWWGGDDAAEARATSADATAALPPPDRHAPHFGDRDQWVLSGELGAGVFRTTYGGVSSSSTTYSVSPSFDYFVAAHVSLGLGGTLSHSSFEAPRPDGPKVQDDQTFVGAVGRLGVDIPLSSAFSLWPRASLAVGRSSYDERSGADAIQYAVINVTPALYVPLLVHFAPHAFVGIGPFVAHDLSNEIEGRNRPSNLATTVGARLLVGGWL